MKLSLILEKSGKSKAWYMQFNFSTEAICLKAVERNGYALRYVNPSLIEDDVQ